jgi:glycosyltransferase involved in cell wall biosynthesis
MRIACLLRVGCYYGAENMVLLFAKHMAVRHDVWYCSPNGVINGYLKEAGVTHVPIEKVTVSSVKHLMKTLKPDIFLVLDNKASLTCALAGVPFVSYQQNNWPFISGFNFYSLGMLFYSRRAKKVVGVSDHLIKAFRFSKFIRDKYVTLPNVVELSRVRELAGELPQAKTYDICFCGRLAPQKSPSTFVRVVKKVLESRPETTSIMVGGGETETITEVNALTLQLGLQDKIVFTGFLENPFEVIKQSRLLFMPSIYEGKCVVVIEAMSLGLPVIARRAPGLEDDVDDTCGALCDTEEEFYAAIMEHLNNDELYQKKSQGALARAEASGDVEKFAIDFEKICIEAAGLNPVI